MWLACYSQQEIADSYGCPRKTVNDVIVAKKDKCLNSPKPTINHNEETFKIPIYNIWKNQNESSGMKHFCNTEPYAILFNQNLSINSVRLKNSCAGTELRG